MSVIKPTVRSNLGGLEMVSAHGNTGTTETINLGAGNVHTATLDDNCTFTFTGAVSGLACAFTLVLTQDGTGSRTVTWPGSVTWPGGSTPVLATAAGSVDEFVFMSEDGGTSWRGHHITRAVGSYGGVTWTSGTSMPGSPSTNNRVTRTDLGLDFYYDGTRWLTAGPPMLLGMNAGDLDSPLGAGSSPNILMRSPLVTGTGLDLWVVTFNATTFVPVTNTGSHYWTIDLRKVTGANAGTVIATFNTSADTHTVWTPRSVAVGASVDLATYKELDVLATKTGTPGDLYWGVSVSVRLIGT